MTIKGEINKIKQDVTKKVIQTGDVQTKVLLFSILLNRKQNGRLWTRLVHRLHLLENHHPRLLFVCQAGCCLRNWKRITVEPKNSDGTHSFWTPEREIGFTSLAISSTKQQVVGNNITKQLHILYFTKNNSYGSWNQTLWGPALHKAQTSPTVGWCSAPSDVESTQRTSAPFPHVTSLLLAIFICLTAAAFSRLGYDVSLFIWKQNPQPATQFCSTFLSLFSTKEHGRVWSAKIGRRKNNREAVDQRNLPDAREYCKHCLSQDKMAVCIEIIPHHLIRKSTTKTRTSLWFWMLYCTIRCRRQ